ncbi:MAG: YciI family protein [Lysobacteraceae bacterium]
MKVMAIVKATPDSEAGRMPDPALFEAMDRFNHALADAGVLLAGEGLKPSSAGVRVHYEGAQRHVVDGPFAETKELIAGFWLWQVRSMEEAVEWARRCPNPHHGPCVVELRPLYEADDFGEAFTPELREREEQLRARLDTPS